MLNIDRSVLNELDFDFSAALEQFRELKRQHAATAPRAHSLVEEAYAAGGFRVVEPTPVAAALMRLKKLKGKTVGTQLDEFQSVLILLLETMFFKDSRQAARASPD